MFPTRLNWCKVAVYVRKRTAMPRWNCRWCTCAIWRRSLAREKLQFSATKAVKSYLWLHSFGHRVQHSLLNACIPTKLTLRVSVNMATIYLLCTLPSVWRTNKVLNRSTTKAQTEVISLQLVRSITNAVLWLATLPAIYSVIDSE